MHLEILHSGVGLISCNFIDSGGQSLMLRFGDGYGVGFLMEVDVMFIFEH